MGLLKMEKIFFLVFVLMMLKECRDQIYIVSHNLENTLEKIKFLVLLEQLIGYQKIDVIISKDSIRLMEARSNKERNRVVIKYRRQFQAKVI